MMNFSTDTKLLKLLVLFAPAITALSKTPASCADVKVAMADCPHHQCTQGQAPYWLQVVKNSANSAWEHVSDDYLIPALQAPTAVKSDSCQTCKIKKAGATCVLLTHEPGKDNAEPAAGESGIRFAAQWWADNT